MIRSYYIRIYPTKEQEELMWKHIGCCRFVWNYMLALQLERYKNKESFLSRYDLSNHLTQLKKTEEYKWLSDVGSHSLTIVLRDLDQAYSLFFKKKSRLPKFKCKKTSKQSFPIRHERFYFKDDRLLHVEKIGKIKYKTDYQFPLGRGKAHYMIPRIHYDDGKWFLTFSMECENQASELTDISMGIDLGVKELAVVEFNNQQFVFHNINKSKKMRTIDKKIQHEHRVISRKYECIKSHKGDKTRNILREEAKLRKLYKRQANIRRNYIHQVTHSLVSMLPKRIVAEDLNVLGLLKNRYLSKAIGEQKFGEFLRQVEYKSANMGIEFVRANRFYPSSKTCSHCGSIKHNLTLKDRVFVCPSCGFTIDRDYNAAINLSRYVV